MKRRVIKTDVPRAAASWRSSPVLGADGRPLLYDIYIDDRWVGSARTRKQCDELIQNSGGNLPASPRRRKIRGISGE